MILKHLELRNFRNYETLSLDLDPSLNEVIGSNGVGKSNLAEAIHYLSLARSWRTSDERLLIKDGADEASIIADIEEGPLHREVEITIGRDRKRITLNGKPVRRLSELSRLVNVIVFSPADVPLFLGSPGERRGFLDLSISKHSLDYFTLIGRYDKLLKERNAALKAATIDARLVDVITEQMIEVSYPLIKLRALYIKELNRVLPGIVSELKGPGNAVELVYRPFVKADENFTENARNAFQKAKESDYRHRATSVGPHREDFSLLLNGKDIADYGSQGENRIAVLCLKMAPYSLIEDEGKKPIVVLDDVYSELDDDHAARLGKYLKGLRQVFVTATKTQTEGASLIEVTAGKATRRN
ncbi:MAG: DNA replication/repair protein RecF [Bacilli bacterium]|nr:DNA replication/repair protein RecF [Bacilli bacterium]